MNMNMNMKKKGYRAFKHLNFQAQQALLAQYCKKGRPVTGLAILQPFRGYQRELVSVGLYQKGSWCGKPRSGSSSAIRWSNPFVVDPIAASWHIVSAGSLVVYCWWSRIPPAGGQGPFHLVIEEHFAVPSPSLRMMLPIPRQVPLLTKQILSIKIKRKIKWTKKKKPTGLDWSRLDWTEVA
ncbi:hypothetical protein F4703DRAFT_1797524 [Phycomyces blakesleeanus]